MIRSSTISCSFCNKNEEAAECIIRGHSGYICNDCVKTCVEMIQESNTQLGPKCMLDLYPKEIYDLLSKEVIGQDAAKRAISVAAFMHLQRIKEGTGEKSNVLLIGPTGSGKTLLIKTLAKLLRLPAAIIDATTLTEVGYIGEDPGEAIATKLFYAANKDVTLAECGIVFIDEIDKIAKSDTVQVSRIGVQRSLLTILEDTTLNITSKSKQMNSETISICTKNILFICSGAFIGIDKVAYNSKFGSKIGFCKPKNLTCDILPKDFVSFGLMEELVARLPIIVRMNSLTAKELENMMHFSESSPLKKYQNILEKLKINLNITKQGSKTIADRAIKSGMGARAVKIQLESIVSKAVFNIDRKKQNGIIEINKKIALGYETARVASKKIKVKH